MSDGGPILNYAPPPRRPKSGFGDALRLLGAVACVFGILLGALFIFGGASVIWSAFGPRSTPFWRSHLLFKGGLIVLIGLLMAGFSVRWFYFATRGRVR